MVFRRKHAVVLAAGAVVLAALPVLAQRGPGSGPVARYDMRAGTISGFGAMGGGMGGALGMMLGGGGNRVQHELYLRLGSSRTPANGAAKADHFMPPSAKLGKSVALVTPKEERVPDEFGGQKPKGRLLLFWGCGEHAAKGQPVVIDFAKLAAGQTPAGLWTSSVIRDWGPNAANSKTFGRWPAEDGKYAKPDTALPGAHRVAGNYSPEIAFTLTRDFMAAIGLTSTAQASGSTLLKWGTVPDATGYIAWQMGGKRGPGGNEMGDMVMWTSSASRQFGGGLSDWLTTAQAAALVKDRTLLPPSATTCTVPAEVKAAGPDFALGSFTAFGPQEDFSYPPRPADPRAAWNLEWTARVRHRSMTTWMAMPGMAGMQGQVQDGQAPQQQCKPKKGLGGILGGVLKPGSC